MSPSDATQVLEAAKAAWSAVSALGLWWLKPIAGLVGLIRIWQLLPVQAFLAATLDRVAPAHPVLARRLDFLIWDRLSTAGKIAVPMLIALLTAVITAGTGAAPWGAALLGAVVAGLGAIGGHHVTKGAGTVVSPLANAAIAMLPEKARSAARATASIAVPLRQPELPPVDGSKLGGSP